MLVSKDFFASKQSIIDIIHSVARCRQWRITDSDPDSVYATIHHRFGAYRATVIWSAKERVFYVVYTVPIVANTATLPGLERVLSRLTQNSPAGCAWSYQRDHQLVVYQCTLSVVGYDTTAESIRNALDQAFEESTGCIDRRYPELKAACPADPQLECDAYAAVLRAMDKRAETTGGRAC